MENELIRTNIIVWIDENEYWDRVYLHENGKLYARVGSKHTDLVELSKVKITKIDTL